MVAAWTVRHRALDVESDGDATETGSESSETDHSVKGIRPKNHVASLGCFLAESQLREDDADASEHHRVGEETELRKEEGMLCEANEEGNSDADDDAVFIVDPGNFFKVVAGKSCIANAAEPLTQDDASVNEPTSAVAKCTLSDLAKRD